MIRKTAVKGLVASLAFAGSVAAAPAASAEPVNAGPGAVGYGLHHTGHDHGDKPDKGRPKDEKHGHGRGDSHHGHGDGHHRHGHGDDHGHRGHGHGDHDSTTRRHPRDW